MRLTITFVILFAANILIAQEKQSRFDNLNHETTGKYDSYLASDGAVYKVGDKITLGEASVSCAQLYSFIRLRDSQTMVSALLKSTQAEILKIRVDGSDRYGYTATAYVMGINVIGFYEIELEQAIVSGEIESFGMTEKKAFTQLKKAKEKLDLQLISQEEYDTIKKDLAKYIR